MSKITKALRQASVERQVRFKEEVVPGGVGVASRPADLWDEVRRWEASMGQRSLQSQGAESVAGIQPNGNGKPWDDTTLDIPAARSNGRVAEWIQALQTCEAELLACEEQIERQRHTQETLEAQVAVTEHCAEEVAKELASLEQNAAQAVEALRDAETAKRVQQQRLVGLRECQNLVNRLHQAEEESGTSAQLVNQTTQAHHQAVEALTSARHRHEQLRQVVEELQHQLGQVLARAETAAQPTKEPRS